MLTFLSILNAIPTSALYFSDSEVRTLEYVTQECMNLADQIAEVEQSLKQS